ncbi:hypothetical protein TMatcc_001112 [Talaromyces marneffei ATCC 18224]|uniref:Uncharacterized protein n=2 Tax=Talaromyces marneffei TaxID=37727 RepID=B6QRU7_TALMQ|nr:uncharacterized protein EYB26_003655 [Talaromyces marneffei]EEA21107.1 hypothetical protein PMAA_049120 [Talaromyces marneffei ATCC 18224]KAE8550042.1 hypothetical protein EYB25_008573 [Talaromyces marneffei]QGA15988.1 hypothetical protein EYB26_003655 [Talaromyces marneffei]
MKTTSSLSTILLCLAVPWVTASANDTLLRYKQPLPPDIEIVDLKLRFYEVQDANPGALIGPENGGWYLKYPDNGKVVAVSTDNLTIELDQRYMSFAHTLKDEGNHDEAADVLRELRENGADLEKLKKDWDCGAYGCTPQRGCSFPFCVNPGAPGKCIYYSGCHYCSIRNRCI